MPGSQLKGAIFDLDGVITASAHLHSHAWKAMFDEYLGPWSEQNGVPFQEFTNEDYLAYVDGKPRYQGVQSFLESRGIDLEFGDPEDAPGKTTCCGLGNRKNTQYQRVLETQGAQVFETSVSLVEALKARGIRVGVASSSKNTVRVLEKAGLQSLFETRVCGQVSAELGLKGKPDPDIFVTAAANLGLRPHECLMVEDAISGVTAGRDGNFGLVLGVARHIAGDQLLEHGADLIVSDLGEISVEDLFTWFESGHQAEAWHLTRHGYQPKGEKLLEALCTVGNGYYGTRGCFECERSSEDHYPGTYMAGVFNKLPSQVADRTIYNNDFVNCPNWLLLELRIGRGAFVSPLDMDVLSYRLDLNMRDAVLERTVVFRDQSGRITRLNSRRFASMADRHVGALQLSVTPLNYSGTIGFRSTVDGDLINEGVARYRQLSSKHLEPVGSGAAEGGVFVHVRTNVSNVDVAMGARTTLYADGVPATVDKILDTTPGKASERFEIDAVEGRTYTVEKIVGIYTSRDQGLEPAAAAKASAAATASFAALLESHAAAWHDLWAKMDIEIDGDRFVQRVARLHAYHMIVTASPHNAELDAGIPARGLHGEAYRGHIFWDEVYIFPFFNAHFPDITRSLLMYRYRRLDGARAYAKESGYRGAMYPWQTADGGDEETQIVHYNPNNDTWGPDLSCRQRHVSIAVFYNTWQYYERTGDQAFLEQYGAEMMLEIARFWTSAATYDEASQRYHISGVMGPDEYHEKTPGADEAGLRDNAYTNMMVVWLLETSQTLIDRLSPAAFAAVSDKIGFQRDEMAQWADLTKRMNVVLVDGVVHQFDGYMDLPELDWDAYRQKYGNIHRMDRILKAENDSPDHYKVAKQADTLMTWFLLSPGEVQRILRQLGYTVDDALELLSTNYAFYVDRTSHGSTLSKVVHAAIAKDMGSPDVTWRWFLEAMRSDIYDSQGGTTLEGIHCGVMAGTLTVIMRNFAGVSIAGDQVRVEPNLPAHWNRLAFNFEHKGIGYQVVIDRDQVEVRVGAGEALETISVSKGGQKRFSPATHTVLTVDYRTAVA